MTLRHCKTCSCAKHDPACQGRCEACYPDAPFNEAEMVNAFAIQLANGVRANQLGRYRAVLHDGTVVDVRIVNKPGAPAAAPVGAPRRASGGSPRA